MECSAAAAVVYREKSFFAAAILWELKQERNYEEKEANQQKTIFMREILISMINGSVRQWACRVIA